MKIEITIFRPKTHLPRIVPIKTIKNRSTESSGIQIRNFLSLTMFKARRTYWFAQVGGWALLSLLIFSASVFSNQKVNFGSVIISASCFFIFGMILSHFMRYFFIRMNWLNVRLPKLMVRVLLTSILVSIIMSFLNILVSHLISGAYIQLYLVEFSLDVFATLVFFILWNSVYFTFHFFQRSKEQEVSNLKLTASHNEIELKNLRSQLNPHFLFNSLNSIRALVDIEPELAKESITKLSHLLRKSLVLGSEKLVTLEDELAVVQDYLDLEKVRFEERLIIHHDINDRLNVIKIPPFAIQTLVENALKHGVSKLINGGEVWIRTMESETTYCIEVENTGVLVPNTQKSTGIGVANTIRRLELQYKGKSHFELFQTENNTVIARIKINKL